MAYYKCGSIHPTQNSNVVVDTASGAIANFQTPLAMPLKSLKIDVNAKQDLHGYSYPWSAGGGKNKCSMPNTTFEQFAEVEIDEIPAGSYAYSAVITSTDTDSDKCAIIFLDAEKNILTSKLLNRSVGTSRISTTFTVSSPIKFLHLYAASGFPSGVGDTASFVDNMICLQSASNPTVFEPYENICPISGWNEISLTKCGKNLLNVLPLIDDDYYSLNSDGSLKVLKTDNRGWNSVSVITRLKKGTYTLSRSLASGNCDVRTSLDNYASGKVMGLSQTSKTFTLSDDADIKVKFGYGLQSGYPFDCFYNISVGSSATTYEPYNGTTEVINLGGTYYGGHFTQDKAGHRQLIVDMEIGSIASNYLSGLSSSYIGYDASVPAMNNHPCIWVRNWKYPPNAKGFVSGGIKALCNAFKISMNNSSIISTQYRIYFDVDGMGITSVADFISAIETMEQNGKSLDVCYELATPIIIDLPDGEPIKSFPGINNIFCDTGDTSLQFRKIG